MDRTTRRLRRIRIRSRRTKLIAGAALVAGATKVFPIDPMAYSCALCAPDGGEKDARQRVGVSANTLASPSWK